MKAISILKAVDNIIISSLTGGSYVIIGLWAELPLNISIFIGLVLSSACMNYLNKTQEGSPR